MKRPPRTRVAQMEPLEPRHLLVADFLVNLLTPRNQTSDVAGTAIDINAVGDAVVVYSGKVRKMTKAFMRATSHIMVEAASSFLSIKQPAKINPHLRSRSMRSETRR